MDFMKSYPKIGQDSRLNVVYHNEIGVLGINLNRMLDKIDTLSKEIQLTQKQKYEIEIAKKQMEISAFRNQINPHFCTIRWSVYAPWHSITKFRTLQTYRHPYPICSDTRSKGMTS